MRVFRKYLFVALLSARTNMVYLVEVASRLVFLSVILWVMTCLWQVVFKQNGGSKLGDLSFHQIIWYLTATEAFILSAPRVAANVDLDVRSGALISYLQRPISYPLYSLASNLGERGVRFVVNLAVGAFIATLLVGVPHFTFFNVLFFALSLPMALVIDFLAAFLIGLGAFWLEDTNGIFLIYSRFVMLLGGMLFPITLFPDSVRPVIEWLPFAAILYGPAKMLVAPTDTEFYLIIGRQFIGLLVFSAAVAWLYDRASKRVFVNGG